MKRHSKNSVEEISHFIPYFYTALGWLSHSQSLWDRFHPSLGAISTLLAELREFYCAYFEALFKRFWYHVLEMVLALPFLSARAEPLS